jgi:arylsulfatase A-like enzyme
VTLVFAEALLLAPGKAQGWTFYLTAAEAAFEVVVRLVFAALAGIALGTLCTAAVAPFLWYFKSSREVLADRVTRVAAVLAVFFSAKYALEVLLKWSYQVASHRGLVDTILLAAFYLGFAVALFVRRTRKEIVNSLNGLLGEKMTRRAVIATVGGAAALVVTEFALAKSAPVVRAALAPQRPKSNFLLITFDALSAEDISFYGYRLPTTPNLDAFARKATTFANFYSTCTFTTPSVAAMLTGVYPSESGVYQLQGRLRAKNDGKNLPNAMRVGAYTTGGFFSNPYAYFLSQDAKYEFDAMPEPVFQKGGLQHLWDATTPLHQDSGIGSRIDEYFDLENLWNELGRMPHNLSMRFRAAASFEHGQKILNTLPDGHFLWVHVMTPHHPFLPDRQDRGRFLPYEEGRSFEEEAELRWRPHYSPDQQSQVDRRRLLYDEFILTADRAFGNFIAALESDGKLQDTTVIVSADHGESFEGGVFRHESPYLTRPVIHVPLIIRTPCQQDSRTVSVTADQTSLAPTILELAGVATPESMRGPSLVKWLSGDAQGEGEGQAFCQYLEKNSVFKPLHHGTVGVIDGKSSYQYVLDLDTQKGSLRPLDQAQIWNLDRSAENPALAEQLRAAIYARFPELVQKPT